MVDIALSVGHLTRRLPVFRSAHGRCRAEAGFLPGLLRSRQHNLCAAQRLCATTAAFRSHFDADGGLRSKRTLTRETPA